MKNKSVTLKLNVETLERLKREYHDFQIPFKGEYVIFKAYKNGVDVTVYENKKGEYFKVIFLGNNNLLEAKKFDENAEYNIPKEVVVEHWLDFDEQIGSDEVGVGDLFLPMIVVAVYASKSDIAELLELGIHDSKKMNDETIRRIGPKIVKRYRFSKLTLSNEKYNLEVAKGENLNTLKAKMHNQALANMLKKYPKTKNVYIDQFVKDSTYYKYLKNEKEVVDCLAFKTKGESFYPSIALASVIARYAFLLEKDMLEKKYKMTFPFGANKIVDEFCVTFIKKHGLEEFKKLVKQNFKNYKNVLNEVAPLV